MFNLVPYLKARYKMGVSLSPAISKHLKAFLYGWLPLSDAPGIVSLQIVPLSDAYGIFSVAMQHTKQPPTSVILKNK